MTLDSALKISLARSTMPRLEMVVLVDWLPVSLTPWLPSTTLLGAMVYDTDTVFSNKRSLMATRSRYLTTGLISTLGNFPDMMWLLM